MLCNQRILDKEILTTTDVYVLLYSSYNSLELTNISSHRLHRQQGKD